MALQEAWYAKRGWLTVLRPVSAIFSSLTARRRRQYQSGDKPVWQAPVPVIVVGNISVGGTGKSPLVIWLVEWLRSQGYKPGVISRGYGANPSELPFQVDTETKPAEGGDEPVMIVRRTGVPLVIDPDRAAAGRYLLEQNDCDIIISDDGMQHYALGRDIEIAVIDGQRGFANGRCLPEGPLREPVSRLSDVDLIVVNGDADEELSHQLMAFDGYSSMSLRTGDLHKLDTADKQPLADWRGRNVHAAAAIGNPQRFFNVLRIAGLTVNEHSFADHHQYKLADFAFGAAESIIMTEKDAVKCTDIPLTDAWYLPVEAQLTQEFPEQLLQRLDALKNT